MLPTRDAARSFLRRIFSFRMVLVAAVLVGMSLTAPVEAARKDRAGAAQVRQTKVALKRLVKLEKTATRSIERTPAATVRLLAAMASRGAPDETLIQVAQRGTQKIALLKQRLTGNVLAYTDGLYQTNAIFVDDDGVGLIRGVEDLSQGALEYLRDSLVSEDLVVQVIIARQNALAAIEDAALLAQAQILSALEDAMAL